MIHKTKLRAKFLKLTMCFLYNMLFFGDWFFLFFGDYSARPKTQDVVMSNGEASNSKKRITTIDDVLKGLVEWLCAQVCIHLGIGKVGLVSSSYLMAGYIEHIGSCWMYIY